MPAERHRLPPTLLPDGEDRQLWVIDGRLTGQAVDDAVSALDDGARADVVTFDEDPREDPSALSRPVAVLRAGRRAR